MIRIFLALLLFTQLGQGKIYDCFLFFNETELLKIRLEELYDQVDYFVICEATETFQGEEKPLNFFSHRALYEKYEDKILYFPIEKRWETHDPWERERYQRNQILRALKGCERSDIILLSDLDEIPSASSISLLPKILEREEILFFQQRLFRYHLNRFDPFVSDWLGSVASHYSTFRKKGPERMRQEKQGKAVLQNGGWHFTFMGGYGAYREKLKAYSHTEYNRERYTSTSYYEEQLSKYPLISHRNILPTYVQDHWEELLEKGFLAFP